MLSDAPNPDRSPPWSSPASELFYYADKLATDPIDGETTLPGEPLPPKHWQVLADEVRAAVMLRRVFPDQPYYEIGRFEALRCIGIGGFGIVFEARDPELDRRVALKLCLARDPAAADALISEAKVMAKLAHPNIVAVYEVGRHGDDVFFAMEYVDGLSGHDLIAIEPNWVQVVALYLSVGQGLAAAHDAGIVHRDFKPANVLFDGTGRPRIADFGLAYMVPAASSDADRDPRPVGTLPYMAPEVLRGEGGGPLADQWSFCVAIWESLERALPWEASTPLGMLEQILLIHPQGKNPDVPRKLRAILQIGLSIRPEDRYPNMHVLLAALTEVGADEVGDDAPAVAAARPLAPSEPRLRSRMSLLAGGALGVVSTLAVVVLFSRGQPPSEDGPPPNEAEQTDPARDSSPCMLDDRAASELDAEVVEVCAHIRRNEIEDAHRIWKQKRDARIADQRGLVELAADTKVIARTFADQAQRLESSDPNLAALAVIRAEYWTADHESTAFMVESSTE